MEKLNTFKCISLLKRKSSPFSWKSAKTRNGVKRSWWTAKKRRFGACIALHLVWPPWLSRPQCPPGSRGSRPGAGPGSIWPRRWSFSGTTAWSIGQKCRMSWRFSTITPRAFWNSIPFCVRIRLDHPIRGLLMIRLIGCSICLCKNWITNYTDWLRNSVELK